MSRKKSQIASNPSHNRHNNNTNSNSFSNPMSSSHSSNSTNVTSPLSNRIHNIAIKNTQNRKRKLETNINSDENTEPKQKKPKLGTNPKPKKPKKPKKFVAKNPKNISLALSNVYCNFKDFQKSQKERSDSETTNESDDYRFKIVGYKTVSVAQIAVYNLIHGTNLKNTFSKQKTKKESDLPINLMLDLYVQNFGTKVLKEIGSKGVNHKKIVDNKQLLQSYLKRNELTKDAAIFARNLDKYLAYTLQAETEQGYDTEKRLLHFQSQYKKHYIEKNDEMDISDLYFTQWLTREQYDEFEQAKAAEKEPKSEKEIAKAEAIKKCPKYNPGQSDSLEPAQSNQKSEVSELN